MIDRETRQLDFHVWYPGCPMEDDAYGIPKPKGTDKFEPELLLVPCVGYGDGGVRLGYGGGFYDRTLAALSPRPYTVGVGYGHGYVPWLEAEPHDVPLDAMITEDGVFWERERDWSPLVAIRRTEREVGPIRPRRIHRTRERRARQQPPAVAAVGRGSAAPGRDVPFPGAR